MDTTSIVLIVVGLLVVEARLAAYDQTERLDEAALRLDTSTLTPEQAAAAIDRAARPTVAGAPSRPVPSDHGRRTP